MCFVFYTLIQVWPSTRRKINFTLSLVFSEGSKLFLTGTVSQPFCTLLNAQAFMFGHIHTLKSSI